MPFKIELLENPREIPAKHYSHFTEPAKPNQDCFKLVTEKNTFMMAGNEDKIIIYPAFEDVIEISLKELVNGVRELSTLESGLEKFYAVELRHFPEPWLQSQGEEVYIEAEDDSRRLILYQQLKTPQEYATMLKKFRHSGYYIDILFPEHIKDIAELTKKWAEERKQIAKRQVAQRLSRREGEMSVDFTQRKQLALEREFGAINNQTLDVADCGTRMLELGYSFYGAWENGELVAMIQTMGNKQYHSFLSRAGLRRNSKSPQEQLETELMRQLADNGLTVIERGLINPDRAGHIGLVKYKQKFGELKWVYEITKADAKLRSDRDVNSNWESGYPSKHKFDENPEVQWVLENVEPLIKEP